MSEAQEESKEEEKPDLKPFLGLVEQLSRSFASVLTVFANLPEDMTNTARDDDNLDLNRKSEIAFRLGRTYQLLRLLHRLYTDNFADNFFSRPRNVERLMIILSYLAEAYWAYKDKKLNDVFKVINAISEANSNLEDYLIDVINSAFNDDPDDDYSDDDESNDGSS